jgi:predicted AlkP superfamily phosphohydrolase/phosphomutase
MKRRDFIKVSAAGALASSGCASLLLDACGGPTYKDTDRRLIILALDGLDSKVLERFISDGRLPNFAKLIGKSGIQTVETTTPAESATAWVSLATGLRPDESGAFASIGRHPADYSLYNLPIVHKRRSGWLPWGRELYESTNVVKVPAFWETAARSGIRTVALRVPYDVPPPEVPGSSFLGGPGLPDATLGDGRYHYLSTNSKEVFRNDTLLGGFAGVLEVIGKNGRGTLYGPPGSDGTPAELPFEFIKQNAQTVDIIINGVRTSLSTQIVSGWIPATFSIGGDRVRTSATFYLISAEPEIRIYVSPLNFLPDDGAYRLSYPGDFASELSENYGPYHAAGRAFDTVGLADGATLKNVFGENWLRINEERSKQLLGVLSNLPWNLFFHFDDSIEQIQHIFYKYAEADPGDPSVFLAYGDLLHKAYELTDKTLGDIINRASQINADVIVLSAYGCSGVDYWVNLNAWLRENGYLTTRGKPKELRPTFAQNDERYFGRAFEGVDWSKTRAYSCGPGFLYINRNDREGKGTVKKTPSLVDEIASKLTDFRHGSNKVCADVEPGEKVFPELAEATRPDLVVSLEPGYQTSGACRLGLTGPSIITKNDTFWIGGHTTANPALIPGLFLSTADLGKPKTVTEIAGVILSYFDI